MVTMANGHRTAASHPWHDLFIGERPCKAPNRAAMTLTRYLRGMLHVSFSKTAVFESLEAISAGDDMLAKVATSFAWSSGIIAGCAVRLLLSKR